MRAGDDGILFPGVSGAGKTTLARKVRDVEDVLSDEIVPVRRAESGWKIYASPFWGEFGRGRGSLAGRPLRAIGFLRKGDGLAVERMSKGEAVQRLLETLLCFELDAAAARENMEVATRLAAEVPAFRVTSALETPAEEILSAIGARSQRPTAAALERSSREIISEIRSRLRSGAPQAIVSTGSSMRPWIRSGDTLFIEPIGDRRPTAGDVLVYWVPGETEHDDSLICHRMIAGARGGAGRFLTKGDAMASLDRVRDGREAEVLGTVVAVSRDGKTRPVRGRLGKLALALASLVAAPVLKVREALR